MLKSSSFCYGARKENIEESERRMRNPQQYKLETARTGSLFAFRVMNILQGDRKLGVSSNKNTRKPTGSQE